MLVYPYLKGNLKFIIYLYLSSLISSFSISLSTYLFASLLLFLSSLFFLGIAFLSASFVLIYKQADPINYLSNVLISLFSGVIYPITVLPDNLQIISNIIPATYSLELLREIIFFGNFSFNIDLINVIFIPIGVIIASFIIFNFAITVVKRDGSSGKY